MRKLVYCILFFCFFNIFIFSENNNLIKESSYGRLLNKAKNGDVEAQYKLGEKYLYDKKFRLAINWFKSAANKGSDKAQYEAVRKLKQLIF